MNIQEITQKGKRILADDMAFIAALILLVGLTSFGFGRLSMAPNEETQAARVHMVQEADLEDAVAETEGARYVGSVNSDKYHAEYCTSAERIADANRVWFDSEAEAEAAGYSRAGNCEFY